MARYAPIGAQLYLCEDGLRGGAVPPGAPVGRPPTAPGRGARAALPRAALASFLPGEVDFSTDGAALARRAPFAVHRCAFHRARLAGLLHRAAGDAGGATARGSALLDPRAAPRVSVRSAEGVPPPGVGAARAGDDGAASTPAPSETVDLDVVVRGGGLCLVSAAWVGLPGVKGRTRAAVLAAPPPPTARPPGGALAGALTSLLGGLARGGADAALLRARVPAAAVAAAAAVGGASLTLESAFDRTTVPLRMVGAPSPAAAAAAARGWVRRARNGG